MNHEDLLDFRKIGERMFEGLECHDQLKEQVSQRITGMKKSQRICQLGYMIAACVATLFLTVGCTSLIQSNKQQKNTIISSGAPGVSAPSEFAYPLQVKSETYPVHPNQTIIIQPRGRTWTGEKVELYYISDIDTNRNELLYRKVLPSNVQHIGTASIHNGEWSFQWKVPENVNSDSFGSFLIAAQSDIGTLSGIRVDTLSYNKLELSSTAVRIGEQAQLSGAGFPLNSDVKIELIKDESLKSDNVIVSLGYIHVANGSFTFPFSLSKEMSGHQISPGPYKIQLIIMPPNQQREGVTVNLVVK